MIELRTTALSNRRDIVGREGDVAARGEPPTNEQSPPGRAGGEALKKRDYEMEKQREVEELRRFREEMARAMDAEREDARKQFEAEVRN